MYTLRCDICSCFLPIFQLSRLCPTCYKIRTIVRVYDNQTILKSLENNFLIKEKEHEQKEELADDTKDYYTKPITRLETKLNNKDKTH